QRPSPSQATGMFRNQNNRVADVREQSTRVIVRNRAKSHAKRCSRSEQFNGRFGSEEKIQRPAVHQADPGGSESHADGERLAGQSGSERTVGMDCRAGEAAYKSVIPPKNRYDPKQPG